MGCVFIDGEENLPKWRRRFLILVYYSFPIFPFFFFWSSWLERDSYQGLLTCFYIYVDKVKGRGRMTEWVRLNERDRMNGCGSRRDRLFNRLLPRISRIERRKSERYYYTYTRIHYVVLLSTPFTDWSLYRRKSIYPYLATLVAKPI